MSIKVWWSLHPTDQHGQWQDLHLPLVLAPHPPHHLPLLLHVQDSHGAQPSRQDVPASHFCTKHSPKDGGLFTRCPWLRRLADPLNDGGSSRHKDIQWYPPANNERKLGGKTTYFYKVNIYIGLIIFTSAWLISLPCFQHRNYDVNNRDEWSQWHRGGRKWRC